MQSTILIIEDDADINQLLAKILSDTGCRTLQAYSATEAGLLMEKETVDLILLDLMLPGVPGEAFLKELREVRHLDLPVLVISAKNSLDSKVSLLNSGADDYITKPFEPQEVLARVQAGMRRRQKGRPMEEQLSYKRLVLYPEARKAVQERSWH